MSSSAESRGVKRSRLACLNCRRKKVKCHGEQPVCGFCARLDQECVYPSRSRTLPSNPVFPALDDRTPDYQDLALRMSLIESKLIADGKYSASSASAFAHTHSDEMQLPLDWSPPAPDVHQMSQGVPRLLQPPSQHTNTFISPPVFLPPFDVQLACVDLYFQHCHGQPYCFFHEETFRYEFLNNLLPDYLVLAVLSSSSRFSDDPFFEYEQEHPHPQYASQAWKEVSRQCFESDLGPNHRLVQAATLLALYDFTACKHSAAWVKIGLAVSIAQALHLMTEPPNTLPFSAQEERRRTLWSIYLLDKLATCGRGRPSLFLDHTCQVHLPCSEAAFRTSTPEQVMTLDEFKSLDDCQVSNVDSFARTIAVTSTLSQVTAFAFQQSVRKGQKPPWDHTSEYQMICSQLTRFETVFDSSPHFQRQHNEHEPSEFSIFAYILYHLCHCLLQHPFLLRRQLEACGLKIPTSFLARALESCWTHAHQLILVLTSAKAAGFKLSATMLSYCVLVAGTIHSLFQHSSDGEIRIKSMEALQCSLAHLRERGKFWKNSARMYTALEHLASDSADYRPLLDISLQSVPLDPVDVERLYSLCDYGTMSTEGIAAARASTQPRILQKNITSPNPSVDKGTSTFNKRTQLEDSDPANISDAALDSFFGALQWRDLYDGQ